MDNRICWVANPRYGECRLVERKARTYEELGLDPAIPVYRHFEENPARLQWISQPALMGKYWQQLSHDFFIGITRTNLRHVSAVQLGCRQGMSGKKIYLEICIKAHHTALVEDSF